MLEGSTSQSVWRYHPDVVRLILAYCSRKELAIFARVSNALKAIALGLLYRELSGADLPRILEILAPLGLTANRGVYVHVNGTLRKRYLDCHNTFL